MGLLRNRGIYTPPQPQTVQIDVQGQMAAAARARAEAARVDEAARSAAMRRMVADDPLQQLMNRIGALEERVASLEGRNDGR